MLGFSGCWRFVTQLQEPNHICCSKLWDCTEVIRIFIAEVQHKMTFINKVHEEEVKNINV